MIVYLVIIIVSLFAVYKASVAYNTFIDNNIPVYDGVTYEKKQIEQFIRFKDNFSLWKRMTEINYQLPMNTVDGGFVSFLILVNPAWLANDWDVLIRSFLSVFIFSFTLYHFLSYLSESKVKRTLIVFLILQLPLFYSERYGLASYIAEIPSALLLLSGYLQVLIFYRNKSLFNFLFGLTLMVVPIFFRLNFAIYTSIFLIPLFFLCLKNLRTFSFWKNSVVFIYSTVLLVIAGFYFIEYFEYFIGYYVKKEIAWEGHGNLSNSIIYFANNVSNQIGLIGFFSFVFIISLISLKKEHSFSYPNYLLVYPFLTQFFVIIIVGKTVNVPHVITAISLSVLLTLFTIKIKKQIIFKSKQLILLSLFFIAAFNFSFYRNLNKLEQTLPEYKASYGAVQFIQNHKLIKPEFKYISFVDDVAEVPIDIALYKKGEVYLKSQDHFYYHDYGWYHNIDKKMNATTCLNHYLNKIDNQEFDLILMDEGINKDLEQYPFSKRIHTKVRSYLQKSPNYKVVQTERTKLNGEIRYYAKVIK